MRVGSQKEVEDLCAAPSHVEEEKSLPVVDQWTCSEDVVDSLINGVRPPTPLLIPCTTVSHLFPVVVLQLVVVG